MNWTIIGKDDKKDKNDGLVCCDEHAIVLFPEWCCMTIL